MEKSDGARLTDDQLCEYLIRQLNENVERREIREFVNHIPELLSFAKNRRATRVFFQSKHKIIVWVSIGIAAWIQILSGWRGAVQLLLSTGT